VVESSINLGGKLRFWILLLVAAPGALAQGMAMDDIGQGVELHFAADFNFRRDLQGGAEPSAFSLGTFDALVHARLSQTVTVLSEVVYEGGADQPLGLDIERLTVNWEPARWFRLSAGRFHTPLGYWNVTHHHAKWMFVTADAPLLMRYEDENGPLPMHTIGVLAHGSVPVGFGHIEYDLGVGNGRGPASDPPQSFNDVNEGKSVVAALHFLTGPLRIGVSALVDQTHKVSRDGPVLDEQIAVGDVVFAPGMFEAVAEGALIHHRSQGVDATDRGGYVQLSYGIGEHVRPYARIERYVHDAADDYLSTPTTTEVLGGLRADPISSVAVKLEGAFLRVSRADQPALRAQVSWLF
jgi:hypothetical protein